MNDFLEPMSKISLSISFLIPKIFRSFFTKSFSLESQLFITINELQLIQKMDYNVLDTNVCVYESRVEMSCDNCLIDL